VASVVSSHPTYRMSLTSFSSFLFPLGIFLIDVPMRLRQFLGRQRKACAPQYPEFGQVLAAWEVWRKSCRGAETFGD
jgi:hypothetical protein